MMAGTSNHCPEPGGDFGTRGHVLRMVEQKEKDPGSSVIIETLYQFQLLLCERNTHLHFKILIWVFLSIFRALREKSGGSM